MSKLHFCPLGLFSAFSFFLTKKKIRPLKLILSLVSSLCWNQIFPKSRSSNSHFSQFSSILHLRGKSQSFSLVFPGVKDLFFIILEQRHFIESLEAGVLRDRELEGGRRGWIWSRNVYAGCCGGAPLIQVLRRQTQANLNELEASVVYIMRSRIKNESKIMYIVYMYKSSKE